MSAVIRIGLTDDEPLLTAGLAMLLGAQGDMEVVWQAADGHQALRRAESDPVDVLLLDIQMPGLDGLDTTRRLVSGGAQGRIIILTTFDTDGYVLGAIEAGAAGFLLKSTAPERLVEAVRTVHAGDSVISPGPTRRLLGAVRRGAPQPGAAGIAERYEGIDARLASPLVLAYIGDAYFHLFVRTRLLSFEQSQVHVLSDFAAQIVSAVWQAKAYRAIEERLTEREREILRLVAIGLTNREICDRLWVSMPTVKTHVSHLLAKTGSRDRVQLVLLALRSGVVRLDEVLAQ